MPRPAAAPTKGLLQRLAGDSGESAGPSSSRPPNEAAISAIDTATNNAGTARPSRTAPINGVNQTTPSTPRHNRFSPPATSPASSGTSATARVAAANTRGRCAGAVQAATGAAATAAASTTRSGRGNRVSRPYSAAHTAPEPNTTVVFEPGAVWDALTVLRTSCGRP
ncbi:hypothetical protein PS9374_03017 [Planomonospora sphaerica]|uniref:Uncharacterized protein n=1 Tax=Planomonospora sphaerica TaxID=161355 RepID=A0A161LHW3_9ACTN|nr:hypothetical protein [Planomonospora sphaerica]GAT67364.1 hypothetical protein PS9374_03017 [Planomonospora sphaerica]